MTTLFYVAIAFCVIVVAAFTWFMIQLRRENAATLKRIDDAFYSTIDRLGRIVRIGEFNTIYVAESNGNVSLLTPGCFGKYKGESLEEFGIKLGASVMFRINEFGKATDARLMWQG